VIWHVSYEEEDACHVSYEELMAMVCPSDMSPTLACVSNPSL